MTSIIQEKAFKNLDTRELFFTHRFKKNTDDENKELVWDTIHKKWISNYSEITGDLTPVFSGFEPKISIKQGLEKTIDYFDKILKNKKNKCC
jgi:hypothetical protein